MSKNSGLAAEGYLRQARQEIAAWETGQRSYFARLGDFALNPAAKLTARMVPQSIQVKAGQVIEKTLRQTAEAGKFSVDDKAITKQRSKHLGRKKALGLRLKACDELAKQYWNSHCGYAAAEGAATGVIGLAGFVADIPLILSIAIREIRTIALCYGYSSSDPRETEYVLEVLRLTSSGHGAARTAGLKTLKELEQKIAHTVPQKKTASTKPDTSLHEFAKSLAIELVQRRALQVVPIAGAVTGAAFNAAYANDVGRTAFMCYRRRFLHEPANFPAVKNQGYLSP
jgi:hypothetical protein